MVIAQLSSFWPVFSSSWSFRIGRAVSYCQSYIRSYDNHVFLFLSVLKRSLNKKSKNKSKQTNDNLSVCKLLLSDTDKIVKTKNSWEIQGNVINTGKYILYKNRILESCHSYAFSLNGQAHMVMAISHTGTQIHTLVGTFYFLLIIYQHKKLVCFVAYV